MIMVTMMTTIDKCRYFHAPNFNQAYTPAIADLPPQPPVPTTSAGDSSSSQSLSSTSTAVSSSSSSSTPQPPPNAHPRHQQLQRMPSNVALPQAYATTLQQEILRFNCLLKLVHATLMTLVKTLKGYRLNSALTCNLCRHLLILSLLCH